MVVFVRPLRNCELYRYRAVTSNGDNSCRCEGLGRVKVHLITTKFGLVRFISKIINLNIIYRV
jgi:hypothetical protein